ncbi:MAG: anti-sigma factor [Firmicutes bacterium]|nr:anti-sigma factor [Bacillota bacterium]
MTAGIELCSLRELYVLDGLTAGERAAFEQHLQACTECQAEVAALQDVSEYLLYDFADVAPPSGMRERVLDALFAEKASDQGTTETLMPPLATQSHVHETAQPASSGPFLGSDASQSPRPPVRAPEDNAWKVSGRVTRRRSRLWPVLAGIVTVASLAWAIDLHLTQPQMPTPLGQVVQSATLSAQTVMASAQAKVWVNQGPNGRNMVLQFSGLHAVEGTQVYQIWLVREAKTGLQVYSGGVFTPNAKGDAVFTFALPPAHYSIVAVTLEPKAIDKTPLGPKVLVGQMNV